MGPIWVAAFAFDLAYHLRLTGIACAAWTAQVMTCKRAASLAAETNGEVELGTPFAHREVAEKEDATRSQTVFDCGGPTFSEIVKDPPRHEDSAGEADFRAASMLPRPAHLTE